MTPASTETGRAEDAALARRIAAGDTAAESELVARFARGLSYMLRRLVSDPALAEDVQQETLRVVIEKARAGKIARPESLGGFIRGTARNLVLAELRRRGRRTRRELGGVEVEAADPSPGALDRLERDEDRRRVRRLLAELSQPRDRDILFRFYLAEESKPSICAALGIEERQFNLVLFRARQRFRVLIEAAEPAIGSAGVKE